MLFSEIIGQNDVKQHLLQTVREQRIPHAQLFFGPEGVGKLQLAIAYAQYIACPNHTATDSCGHCPSCLQFKALQHPDLHLVFPVIKPTGKQSVVCDDFVEAFRNMVLQRHYFGTSEWYEAISNESKAGMIYANESNEIVRKLSLKAYEAEYKTMIIWLPEKMNSECANKLLKILEEPPEKTIFLLVSNEPDRLLTTILSRTQQLKIPRLTDSEIRSELCKRDEELSRSDVENMAHTANGSMLAAIRLLESNAENALNFNRFVQIMRWAWMVGNRKDYASLMNMRQWSDDMAAKTVGRERQKGFLAYAQHMVRENYVQNLQCPTLNYMTDAEQDFAKNFAAFVNERNVEDLMNELARAEQHIEQNGNAKMVFFDLVLKLIVLLKR